MVVSEPYYATSESSPGAKRMPSGNWGILARDVGRVYGSSAGSFRLGKAMPDYLSSQDLQAKATTRADKLYNKSISEGYSKEAAGKIAAAAYSEIRGSSAGSPYGAPKVNGATGVDVASLPQKKVLEIRQNVRETMARRMPSQIGKGLSAEVSKLGSQYETYNKSVEAFNTKYGGRELSSSEMTKAVDESKRLESSRVRLEETGTFLQGQAKAAGKVEEHKAELERYMSSGSISEKIQKGTFDSKIYSKDPIERAEARVGLGLLAATEQASVVGEKVGVSAVKAVEQGLGVKIDKPMKRFITSTTGAVASTIPASGLMLFGFGQAVKMGAETGLRMLDKPPSAKEIGMISAVPVAVGASVGLGMVESAIRSPARTAGQIVGTSIVFTGANILGRGISKAATPYATKTARTFSKYQTKYRQSIKYDKPIVEYSQTTKFGITEKPIAPVKPGFYGEGDTFIHVKSGGRLQTISQINKMLGEKGQFTPGAVSLTKIKPKVSEIWGKPWTDIGGDSATVVSSLSVQKPVIDVAYIPLFSVSSGIASDSIKSPIQIQAPELSSMITPILENIQTPSTFPISDSSFKKAVSTQLVTEQITLPAVRTERAVIPRSIIVQRTMPKQRIVEPSAKIGFFFPTKKPTYEREREQGFIPMAKIFGEWKSVGRAVGREMAISRGAEYVRGSPSRSFTIKATGEFVPKMQGGSISLNDFRAPKGKTKLTKTPIWVEKIEYAIDQPGEFMGITEKGRKARRKKRRK